MSGTALPVFDDAQAQDEYAKALGRNAIVAGSQVAPTWTGLLSPWGTDEQGNSGFRVPGLLSGLYGAAGTLLPAGVNLLSRKAGYGLNLPSVPGAEAANASFGENMRWAYNTVPNVEPQNEQEQLTADIASGMASMALPIPAAGLASAAGLGRVATGAVRAVVPTGVGGAALGGAGALAAHGYEEHQRDNLIRDLGLDPDEVRVLRQGGADLTQPDTTARVAHPETGAPATVPFPTTSTTSEDKFETLAEWGRPDIKITTPNFNTTGESSASFGEIAGATLAGLVVAPFLMRHGGKVLDPAIKLLTGQGDQINSAARIAKYNTNLDAVDAGRKLAQDPGQTGAVRGEAPLPGKAGTVMTNIAQAGYDKTRVLTELTNAVAPDSGVAKQMEARIGTVNHSTPLLNMITEQMATGVNKANGGKLLPKWKATVQKMDNLDEEQMAKLDKGLYSGDELNTRAIKFRTESNAGRPVNDDMVFRHNFRNAHSDDLRAAHADMMNDPATAAIAKDIYLMQTAHIHHAVDMGRLTPADAAKILKDRPWQIPSTNAEGQVERALGTRDITTPGWDTPPTRSVDALTQHYAKLYEELSQNRLYDDIIKMVETWQKGGPNRARIVSEVLDAQGKPVPTAEGRAFTVWREGVPHTYQIDNTNLHRAFNGNIIQTKMLMNVADTLRRSYQSGTTGVSAALVGQRPFALISLNRNIPQIATDRSPGTVFGLIDRQMQQMTGGKVGYRGPDPTQWIGSYTEAARGVGAVTARAASDALKRNNNPVTKHLIALKGQVWVDAWAAKLEQRYLSSSAAQRKAEGATGVAASGIYERPTFNISRGSNVGYSPLADTVPGVFHPDGVQIPYTNVRIPGTKGATSVYINMRTLLRDIHQEISEGGNAYYWKQNPHLSPERRTFETRRVIGDPSMHGASVAAQRATHLIPWINPSVQDAVRMMRNLRDNPVAFTLGTVQSLGMAAVGTVLTAMLGGKRHLNMLNRIMSTHDRASNITLFHNPDDENDYTQISLPQRWRFLNPIILEGVAEGVGAFGLHQGEDTYNRVVHALADLYNHHISHSTVTAAREGLEDFVGVLQPSPVLQLGAAVAGKQINEPVSQLIQNRAEGRPLLSGMVSDKDKATRLPGQAAGNSFVSSDDANWVHQVLKSVLGIAGDGYLHATNFVERAVVTHDLADAFGGLVTDAGQSWRDNAPFGNMIWGNNVKTSMRNPIEEANRVAWARMSDPSFPKQSDVDLQGLTRRGGQPIGISGSPKISSDPQIIQMVGVVNNYTALIQKTVQPQINDVTAQIKSVDDNSYMSGPMKREQRNKLVAKKNELEGQKNLHIEKMNAALSWMAGGKHVNISTFDPSAGMEQFHD